MTTGGAALRLCGSIDATHLSPEAGMPRGTPASVLMLCDQRYPQNCPQSICTARPLCRVKLPAQRQAKVGRSGGVGRGEGILGWVVERPACMPARERGGPGIWP